VTSIGKPLKETVDEELSPSSQRMREIAPTHRRDLHAIKRE
jgi:hypothetical protein